MIIAPVQKIEQKQILSQTQIYSLNILSLNNCELVEFIRKVQDENPMLELERPSLYEELYLEDGLIDGFSHFSGVKASGNDLNFDIPNNSAVRIDDHIRSQLPKDILDRDETRLFEYLLGLLDPDTGFLCYTTEEICNLTGAEAHKIKKAVNILQSMEPAGIGAKNTAECFIIQAKQKGLTDGKFKDMVLHHMEDIARKRYRHISKKLEISLEKTLEHIEFLKSLNPRPCGVFSRNKTTYIVPDVVCSLKEDGWHIKINDRWCGFLRINTVYKNHLDYIKDDKTCQFLKDKMEQAKLVKRSIKQRRETLMKICMHILSIQEDYIKGKGTINVLTLNDIAEAVQLHVSTVSRAIKDKYIQTPEGVFQIKHFLSKNSSRKKRSSMNSSHQDVKQAIVDLIKSEDEMTPYSDNDIAKNLKKMDIDISRRTIAKYRSEMNIPNAYERHI